MADARTFVEPELMESAVAFLATTTDFVLDWRTKFLKALVKELDEFLDGCDHSVGICECEIRGTIDELKLRLAGRQTCRECGGDGITYSDGERMFKCAVCEGQGSVVYDQADAMRRYLERT